MSGMTPDEAEIAVAAGAAGIVVSNHGGRILDHTPGAAEVLPAIARAVRGRAVVLADGGVRTGVDVLKYLALGADAVLIGRPLVVGAFGGGAEGVALLLRKLQAELTSAMPFTALLTVFFAVVAVIHEQHLFAPVIQTVLAFSGQAQLAAFYIANGLLSMTAIPMPGPRASSPRGSSGASGPRTASESPFSPNML